MSAGLTVPTPLEISGANRVQFSVQLVAGVTELRADALLCGAASAGSCVLTGCSVAAGPAGQPLCAFGPCALLHPHAGGTRRTAACVFTTAVLPRQKGMVLLSALRKNFM